MDFFYSRSKRWMFDKKIMAEILTLVIRKLNTAEMMCFMANLNKVPGWKDVEWYGQLLNKRTKATKADTVLAKSRVIQMDLGKKSLNIAINRF